jgi:1,4-alpha-glucan branching enzyme
MKIGANYLGDKRYEFVVWALLLKKVKLKIVSPVWAIHESPLRIPMEKNENGYWKKVIENIPPGAVYFYRLEEERVLLMRRWKDHRHIFSIFNFNRSGAKVRISHQGEWRKILDSSEEKWIGPKTSLPEIVNSTDEINIKGLSLAVYER